MISLTDIMKGKPVDYFPNELHKFHDEILNRVSLNDKSLSNVMFNVSLYTKVPEKDIRSKTRKKEFVYARHLYAFLAVIMTKSTLQEIANFLYKGYHHASVLYARRMIDNLMFSDISVKKDVEQLKINLKK